MLITGSRPPLIGPTRYPFIGPYRSLNEFRRQRETEFDRRPPVRRTEAGTKRPSTVDLHDLQHKCVPAAHQRDGDDIGRWRYASICHVFAQPVPRLTRP